MRTYLCNYRTKWISVCADDTSAAQLLAAKQFKARKTWEVTAYPADYFFIDPARSPSYPQE